MLWGETEFRQQFTVDREGFVFIPEVGQVFVNGLNLGELEDKISKILSKFYSSLNPVVGKPSTFLDVSLGKLRPLRVMVLGDVAQPGSYTISPTTTLFSSLYYFGGPTFQGSLRDIHLIRNGKKISSIDFYDYLLSGHSKNDVRLQLDDVIFIPKRGKTVSISGEINRPGIYELKTGENLNNLIEIASGLKATTYLKHAQIDRIVPATERDTAGMDRMILDLELGEIISGKAEGLLFDGDKIKLFSILDVRGNVATISGASISRPGIYEIEDSTTVRDLILKADSLLGDVYVGRADIVRLREDLREEIIKIDLEKVLMRDSKHNLLLKPFDRVEIYSMSQMRPIYKVSIMGHVKLGGTYPLLENLSLYDLVFKYGGFEDAEFKEQAYLGRADIRRLNDDNITRKILKFNLGELLDNSEKYNNFLLKPGDIIEIYSKSLFLKPSVVSLFGEVNNPGDYELKDGMNLADLIIESGGLSNDLFFFKIEISRLDPNNKNGEKLASIIEINVNEIYDYNESKQSFHEKIYAKLSSYEIMPYDFITIRSDPNFKKQSSVEIRGEVLYPGFYTIKDKGEMITDIIQRAGGLAKSAYPSSCDYYRDGEKIQLSLNKVLKKPNSKSNIIIKNGDIIIINERPELIFMKGEVNNPGAYKFMSGKRLRYYLGISGGYNRDSDKSSIYVIYPDGTSVNYSRWSLLSPKIKDGSTIVIPKLPETEPLNKTEFASDIASIIGNISQALAMVILARN